MATEFRVLKIDSEGRCACAACAASGQTTAKHDQAPDPPSLDDALRASAEFSNSHGDIVRLVEFLAGEVERDIPIVGWDGDAASGTAKPIIAGPWPDHGRVALYYGSIVTDSAARTTGRWSTLDGSQHFSNVVDVRKFFKTTFADSEPKPRIVDSPTAAAVADPPDLIAEIRKSRPDAHGYRPIALPDYDASKAVPDAPQLTPEHFQKEN